MELKMIGFTQTAIITQDIPHSTYTRLIDIQQKLDRKYQVCLSMPTIAKYLKLLGFKRVVGKVGYVWIKDSRQPIKGIYDVYMGPNKYKDDQQIEDQLPQSQVIDKVTLTISNPLAKKRYQAMNDEERAILVKHFENKLKDLILTNRWDYEDS